MMMMKFYFTVSVLLNLAPAIGAMKRKSVTFKYKEGSNQAYTESSWIGTDCLGDSFISVFAADGFYDDTTTEKTTYKTVSGNGQFYTNCNANGAKLSYIAFATTDNPKKVVFNDKKTGKNATVVATLEAYLLSQDCVVESFTDEFDGEEYTYYYYVCDESYSETFTNITIDTFLRIGPDPYTFTSKTTNTETFRGTVTKYESKSSCQEAIVSKKVIKIGKTRLNIPSFSTYGEICKASSGYQTTTKFI